ncbi:hypothetical protein [Mangrovibrevibacter kandeliae]|uniref:hypothetical protein n=1 Tax=Mangrovibrevibacter kandeliae TaxID=2968473 RepID=UPI0021195E0D|nr:MULTISPECIES: hypothetical protein [unclassified Aurantimonas]MCQ8783572.1 hypothetical protein [Aurantimonas sp. CSK15Z-1]MCW4116468.1 hypothetical protein [Aurantimonas sp. MSK8Z-1]
MNGNQIIGALRQGAALEILQDGRTRLRNSSSLARTGATGTVYKLQPGQAETPRPVTPVRPRAEERPDFSRRVRFDALFSVDFATAMGEEPTRLDELAGQIAYGQAAKDQRY